MARLANFQITAAAAGVVSDPLTGFGKPSAATITGRFTYVASAATSVTVWVQTSIDGGATWWDIACIQFTTASANKYLGVNGQASISPAVDLSDGSLAINTAIHGLLGDRFRTKVTSVGTYGAGTTLTVDIETRG